MASGNILLPISIRDFDQQYSPRSARSEFQPFYDANNNLVMRRALVFTKQSSESINPEAIYDFVMPPTYAATTGITLKLFGAPDKPVVIGNAYMELSLENLTSDTAGNAVGGSTNTTDPGGYWGTPALAAITVSTTSGLPVSGSIALAKANAGPQASVLGTTLQLCRLRLRRLNTNVLDTLNSNFNVYGVQLIET